MGRDLSGRCSVDAGDDPFWTTRARARIFIAAELLLSGRLVPMEVMPAGCRRRPFLPFRVRLLPVVPLFDLSRAKLPGLAMPAFCSPFSRYHALRLALRGQALLGVGNWPFRPLAVLPARSLTEPPVPGNFFIQLLQSVVAVGTALVVLKLVYSHTDELNGWSEPELQVVMGIQILLGGLIKMSIQPNMERLMNEVRDGKLDFALTKPEDSQLFVSVREVRIWRAVDIVAGALVLAYGIGGLEAGVDVGDAALFAAMLAWGALTITASGSSSRPARSGS